MTVTIALLKYLSLSSLLFVQSISDARAHKIGQSVPNKLRTQSYHANERYLAGLENTEVYGGVVLTNDEETFKAQKLLKLKGCCIPSRILTDEERSAFEAMAFLTLKKELSCVYDNSQESVKRTNPCFEMTLVRVESESLVQHSNGRGGQSKTSLEIVTTFEAHANGESTKFASYVANNLGGLLTTMHSRKGFDTLDGKLFDGVDNLEVYPWDAKGLSNSAKISNSKQESSPGGHYVVQRDKPTGSGYLYKIEDGTSKLNSNEKTNMNPNVAMSTSIEQNQKGMIIVESATFDALIICGMFFLVTLTVIFLRTNTQKKSQTNPCDGANNGLPETDHIFGAPEQPVRPRVKKHVHFKGVMCDRVENFYDHEERIGHLS